MGDEAFTWRDGGRTVVFRAGSLADATQILAQQGFESYELVSTGRALESAGRLAEAASAVHQVAPGGVPDAAAAFLDAVGSERLVAFGGGRVIDAAKAVAAVTGAEVAALPTTMSGAEMTGIHRLPAGAEERARGLVRPQLILADPELMTSQPEPALRASSMNALGHCCRAAPRAKAIPWRRAANRQFRGSSRRRRCRRRQAALRPLHRPREPPRCRSRPRCRTRRPTPQRSRGRPPSCSSPAHPGSGAPSARCR